MVILGLLLMLACAALAVDAVMQNDGGVHVTAFGHTVSGLTVGELFVAGAVLGLLFALGLALFSGGLGRAARIRRERRALRRENADAESLRAEKARLEEQLAAERETSSDTTSTTSAYPAEPAAATTSGRHRLRD